MSRTAPAPSPRQARRRRPPALDPAKVKARRRYLRLSTSALAASLGTSTGVIDRLEDGAGQEKLDLAFVCDLARSLGVHVGELVVDPDQPADPEPAPADGPVAADARHLGAVVAGCSGWVNVDDLCDHLGWPLGRVLEALSVVEEQAPAIGLHLSWLGAGVALVPGQAATQVATATATGGRRGFDVDACRLLYRLAHGHKETLLRRETTFAHRRLIATGLAQLGGPDHDTTLELTAEGRYNLGLVDRPPK